MTEVPKEWNGTPEEWNAVVEAFGRIAKAIQKAGRQIVNSFSEFYKRMAAATGNEQAKKRLRQQSIRDRKKNRVTIIGRKLSTLPTPVKIPSMTRLCMALFTLAAVSAAPASADILSIPNSRIP